MGSVRRRLGVRRALVGGDWVEGDVVVDAGGRVVEVGVTPRGPADRCAVPGFVDLQVNGAGGVDVVGATAEGLDSMSTSLAEHGTVAFRPTVFSASLDEYEATLRVVAEARRRGVGAAAVLGAHLEGPFLDVAWCGAHDPATLVVPDRGVLDRLLGTGAVGMMTLAPELAGALELVGALRERGVVVAVGHSDATADQVRMALDAGASMLTHAFNAHRRFTARDPGPAGVALTDPRCTVGLVADGHHLAPETLRLAFAAAGGRIVVVSDAVAPAADEPGTTRLRGAEVRVSNGAIVRSDGTLAGSGTLLDGALRHLVSVGIAPEVALRSLGTAPARLAGLGPHDLRPGEPARAVVLDDRWEVVGTPP